MSEVIDNYTLYAIGQYDGIHKPYIAKGLSMGAGSGTIKEEIVCNLIGAKHNPNGIGVDGWISERPLEVKAETVNFSKKKDVKLSGAGAFGISTHEKLQEFIDADQIYYGSGWGPQGFLVYLIEVEFNKTKMPDQLYEHVNNIYNGSGGQPKVGYKCWKDSYFNVLYLRSRFLYTMTKPFRTTILDGLTDENKKKYNADCDNNKHSVYLASPSFKSILDKKEGDFL